MNKILIFSLLILTSCGGFLGTGTPTLTLPPTTFNLICQPNIVDSANVILSYGFCGAPTLKDEPSPLTRYTKTERSATSFPVELINTSFFTVKYLCNASDIALFSTKKNGNYTDSNFEYSFGSDANDVYFKELPAPESMAITNNAALLRTAYNCIPLI
jgi:hypothetical protein